MSNSGGKNRVWMLLPNFYPHVGGAERQCLKLSKELIAQGVEVTVITRKIDPNTLSDDIIDTVPVRRIPHIRPFEIAVVYWLLYLFKHRHEFDVLHVHMLHEPTLGAVLAAKILRKPVIIKMASSGKYFDPLYLLKNGRFPFNRFIIRSMYHADKIISITHSITSELISWGLPDDKIAAIPNGVESGLSVAMLEKQNIRRQLCIPLDSIVILRVGTFLPIKGVKYLFESWDKITRYHPQAYLLSVGGADVPTEFDDFLDNHKDTIKIYLNQEDITRFYQVADLFVLPSVAEGLSNALLEAGMYGLPSVVTDVGGNAAIIENGKNGIVVPSEDSESLAKGILTLLDDSVLCKKMEEDARKAVQRYAIGKVASQYITLYDSL